MTKKIHVGARIMECRVIVKGATVWLQPVRDCGANMGPHSRAYDSMAIKYARIPNKGWMKVALNYLRNIEAA